MSDFGHTLFRRAGFCLLMVVLCLAGNLSAQAPVASFTTVNQSGCAPLIANFTNNSSNAVSYQWDFGNGNFSTLTNPQNVYIQPGTYTIRLIATSSNGTRDTLTRTNYVTATAGPQLAISVSTYNGCNNYTSFQFSCVSPDATNLSWDFGDGSTSSLMNPVKTYANTGTYSVSLLATNANGCQTVTNLPQPIEIIATPHAGFTVSNNETCDLQEIFGFTSASVTNDTYTWDFGDGLYSSEINPDHIFATSGTFSVELKMTNAFGCADSITLSNLVTIFPDNTPVITSPTLTGCLPFATTLTSQVVGALSYQWNSSDGQSATTPTFNVTYFPAGSYNITLSVAMANGCTYSSPQPTVIQVNPKPTASFTATNTTGCAPLTVNLTNTSIGATNYYWTFGDGGYSFDPVPVYAYTQPGVYTITLKAFNQFGCWRTMTLDNITVTAPVIDATMTNITGCPPLTPVFTNESINAVSYLWNFGDGTSSTAAVPTHTYATLGQYDVTLTAFGSGGCSVTQNFGQVNVTAQLANYPTPPPISGCAPFQTSFGLSDPSITTFNWDFGDGTTSTAASPTHTYETPGNYIVSLQVNDGSICGLSYPVYQQITVEGITPVFQVVVDPCPPHTVHFTDTISDAVSWLWDFGDGTTSTLQNPTHNYNSLNNYHVGLTTTTAAGCTRTFVGFNAVTFTDYQPSFTSSYDPTDPFPTPVTFVTPEVNVVSWLWDFGDGSTSTQSNPTHIYQTGGNYSVTLTVVANGCTLSVTGNAFTVPTQPGNPGNGGSDPVTTTVPTNPFISCAPASIAFFRQSPTHDVIQWTFGDGTTSTETNPLKTYASPGIYNVSYTANTPSGLQTITYPQSIHIGGYLPDMLLTTTSDCSNFHIATNLSNAAMFDQVQWIFGSSAPYPGVQVNYQTPLTNSSINIRAIVTDTLGCAAIRNQNILMDKPVPFVAYPTTVCRDSVHFTQLGGTLGLSFFWQFGDGETSTLAEPVHQYDSTGSYTVQLRITTSQGCVDNYTLPNHIVYAMPKMDVIVNGAWDGCAPHAVQVIYPGPLAYVNYYSGSTFLTNNDTLNLAYPDTGTYAALTMIATTTWIPGCRDTLQFDPIHVYNAYPDFSFTQDVNCLPVTAQFTDESLDAVSWLWDFGNGITSTDQNPVITFQQTPGDSVRLKIITAFGCADSIVKPGIVIYDLHAQVNYLGACNPLQATFAAGANLPGEIEWHFGNGVVVADSVASYTYTTDGIYTPFVVGMTPSGCSDTLWIAPIRVSSIVAGFHSPSPAACAPSIVEFFDTSNDPVSWNWDFGDNSGSALQNPVKLYDSPGIYTISLMVTSAYGCQDTLTIPQYITVLGPATSFTISMQEACVGVPLQFNDMSLDAVEWEWNFGEGSTSTEQNPVFEYAEPGSYVITLFSRDTVGCSAFYPIPLPYVVHDRPTSIFTVASDSGCTPFTPIIDNTSANGISFSWNFGDGSSLITDSIPTHTYTAAGDYFIELISLNTLGCYDTARYEPVRALLVPDAHLSILENTGCMPLEVTFGNQSTNLENPTYQLWFADTVMVSNPDTTVAFSIPGFYDVDLFIQNLNGCTDSVSYASAIEVYDSIPPPVSPIMRVSVEGPSLVIIEWTENNDIHFSHYNILRKDAGATNYSVIATITNPLQLSYEDVHANTQDSVYCYKVEAVDVCDRKLPLDSLVEHCTINIQAITQPNNLIDIDWTPYVGRTPDSYIVLRTDEGTGQQENVGEVPGDETHFVDNTVVCPVKYRYEVLAVQLDGILHLESSSDYDIPAVIQNPFINQYVNIGRSTVVNNEHIFTEWSPPDTLVDKITGYGIYRAVEGEPYFLVAELPLYQTYYLDEQVDVQKNKYHYQVYARNICLVEAGGGVQGDNVVLDVDEYDELHNILTWTPYVGWGPGGVGFYVIEEQKPNGGWEFLISVPGTTNTYLDEND